jgi:hypothetical protein
MPLRPSPTVAEGIEVAATRARRVVRRVDGLREASPTSTTLRRPDGNRTAGATRARPAWPRGIRDRVDAVNRRSLCGRVRCELRFRLQIAWFVARHDARHTDTTFRSVVIGINAHTVVIRIVGTGMPCASRARAARPRPRAVLGRVSGGRARGRPVRRTGRDARLVHEIIWIHDLRRELTQ